MTFIIDRAGPYLRSHRMGILFHIGRYFSFLGEALRRPQKVRVFAQSTLVELEAIGVQSVGIVALLSLFMGAVIAIQTAHQVSGWIPAYTIGFTVRQTMILEFAPTIIPVILSGKVGSNIASQIGTMQVTEQIDALEVMGVRSVSHLVLPKLLAGLLIFPFLVIISMVLGIAQGLSSATSSSHLRRSSMAFSRLPRFRCGLRPHQDLHFRPHITSVGAYRTTLVVPGR